MELTDKIIENLEKINLNNNSHLNTNSIIYINNDYIYKIIKDEYFFNEEFERNINYLINNEITNTPKIYEKLYHNNKFIGYIMQNIKNSMTFKDAIKVNLDEQIKVNAIINIHKALKDIHNRNITLGDIHLDNFLITEDNGYIIDLDYMRFKGEEYKFMTYYDIKPYSLKNKITKSSKYTDIVKTMIASLSLLLKIDLESLINKKDNSLNLEKIYNIIIISTHNQALIAYFKNIIEGKEIYFDDFLIENGYSKVKVKTS